MFATSASFLPVSLRRVGLVSLACSALVLSACGGGDRAGDYKPESIVSFGDENSAFATYEGNLKAPNPSAPSDLSQAQAVTLRGLTYTVTTTATSLPVTCAADDPLSATFCVTPVEGVTFAPDDGLTQYVIEDTNYPNTVTRLEVGGGYKRTTATTYFCNVPTIWVQTVARAFGKGYRDACPLEANSGAVSFAKPGARVVDVVAQINANQASLKPGALVTVMAGQNDILDEYKSLGNTPADAELKAAQARLRTQATVLADAVQRVLRTDAKVILALTPDLGQSPLAYANNAAGRSVLSALTKSFNDHLYITRLGSSSGRQLAGVNSNELTGSQGSGAAVALCGPAPASPDGVVAAENAGNYNLDRLLACNSSSLVAGGSLWADQVRFAPAGHGWIGSLAANRAFEQF